MATSTPSNTTTVGHDEVVVNLKAAAHLRHTNQSSSTLVAAVGIVDGLAGGAGEEYGANKNVLVYMREPQQTSAGQATVHVSDICPMPPHLSFENAAAMIYPFIAGLSILHHELGISLTSLEPDDDVGDVNTVLILGGETALGNALLQLLRISLPSTILLVTCRAEDASPPEDFQKAVRPFCGRAVDQGAKYAIDASAPDLLGHLQAAVSHYGGPINLAFDVTGELAKRPELLGLLDASGIIDCAQAVVEGGRLQDRERVPMIDVGLIFAMHDLQPPLCNDMFVTTFE